MALEDEKNLLKFDKRVTKRNLACSRLSKEELQKHLMDLPDLTDESEDISSGIFSKEIVGALIGCTGPQNDKN